MNKTVIRKISQIWDIFLLIHIMRKVSKLWRWSMDKWRRQNCSWVWEAANALPHERGTQMRLQTIDVSMERSLNSAVLFEIMLQLKMCLDTKGHHLSQSRVRLVTAKQVTKTFPYKEYHRATNTKNMLVLPQELDFVLIFIFNILSGLRWNEES